MCGFYWPTTQKRGCARRASCHHLSWEGGPNKARQLYLIDVGSSTHLSIILTYTNYQWYITSLVYWSTLHTLL